MPEKDEQSDTIQFPKSAAQKGYWEYGHEVNKCSMHDEVHRDECDGNCERIKAPDTFVDLHNEVEEWTMRGMVIQGVPSALANGPFPGINVEVFELEMRFAGLIKYLEHETDWFDKIVANQYYWEVMLEKLHAIRTQVEKQSKPTELAVAKTKLFGPDGEILQ